MAEKPNMVVEFLDDNHTRAKAAETRQEERQLHALSLFCSVGSLPLSLLTEVTGSIPLQGKPTDEFLAGLARCMPPMEDECIVLSEFGRRGAPDLITHALAVRRAVAYAWMYRPGNMITSVDLGALELFLRCAGIPTAFFRSLVAELTQRQAEPD